MLTLELVNGVSVLGGDDNAVAVFNTTSFFPDVP